MCLNAPSHLQPVQCSQTDVILPRHSFDCWATEASGSLEHCGSNNPVGPLGGQANPQQRCVGALEGFPL